MKEQETLALVAALFLGIAAAALLDIPESIGAANLLEVYIYTSVIAIASLAVAVCTSVFAILMWNAQKTGDTFRDLVKFLAKRWVVLIGTPMLCVIGVMMLSSTLYWIVLAEWILDNITSMQPYVLGALFLGTYGAFAGWIL